MNEVRQNPHYSFYKRNVYYVFLCQLIAAIAASAFFFPEFFSIPLAEYSLFTRRVLIIAPITYFVLIAIGLVLTLRNQLIAASTATILGYSLAYILIPFFATDLGFIMSILNGLTIWLIALITMPPPYSRRGSILGIISGLIIVILELIEPEQRFSSQLYTAAIYSIYTTVFLIYAVIFFRNLNYYKLQAKFLFLIISLAIISSIATFLGINQTTAAILNRFTTEEENSSGTLLKAVSENRARAMSDQIRAQFITFQALTRDEEILTVLETSNDQFSSLNEQSLPAVLSGRTEIWGSDDPEFASLKHILFFSTLRNPISDQLQRFVSQNDPSRQIIFTNRFGTLVAMATRDSTVPYLYTSTEWWPVVSGETEEPSRFYIGNPIFTADGELGLPIAMPIVSDSGQFIGAIQTTLSLKDLITDLQSARTTPTGNIELSIIYDNLMIPIESNSISPKSVNFDTAELSNLEGQLFIETDVNNISSLLSASPVSIETDETENSSFDENLLIVVSKPRLDVTGVLQTQRSREVVLGTIIILLSSLIGYTLARLIAGPIRQLSGVAEALESGNLAARAEINSEDEIGLLGKSFNAMADQSQRLVNQLETRVQERTHSLQTSFRVSQALSQIRNKQTLVQAVVDQLRDAFDYYHVHIYLYSPKSQRLELVAGSGSVGEQLLQQNHSLAVGQGLVGRAAQNNMTVLVPNVENEPQWVPNRLLPETKSEVATPIAVGNRVIGVIDVQENEVNRLQGEDTELLKSIAQQVAVALQNAEQFELIQNAVKRESSINQIREKILNTGSIEEAMKTTAKELGRVLSGKKTKVIFNADQIDPSIPDHLPARTAPERMKHHEKNGKG